MKLFSPRSIIQLLSDHGLHPKKSLGQHFLVDYNVLRRIADATGVGPEDHVLEIGTGLGILTRELASRGARVLSVEVDKSLLPVLNETLGRLNSVELVLADFLKLDLPSFLAERWEGKWIVASNLPYCITSPIITKLISSKQLFSRIVVTVQKEVADRLVAPPGSEQYGALTVFVQYHCEVEQLMTISPRVFFPTPQVESALVRLVPREFPAVDVPNEELFFKIVRSAFGKRRKTLLNALASSREPGWTREQVLAILQSAGVDPSRRGETLSITEFAELSKAAAQVLEK
jgi:16S rRNA (adenine1518-N6/adenine1519-N6)-dimethyltransferase